MAIMLTIASRLVTLARTRMGTITPTITIKCMPRPRADELSPSGSR